MSLQKVSGGLNGPTSFQITMFSPALTRFPVSLFGLYDIEVSSIEFSSTSSLNLVLECQSSVLQTPVGPTPYYRFGTAPSTTSSGYTTVIGRKIWMAHGCICNGYIDIQLYDVANKSYGGSLLTNMIYCLITLNAVPHSNSASQ